MIRLLTVTWLATASVALGADPIRLHPANPHYFEFRGKPTVLITSAEHYGAVLNLDFDYKRYLDTLAADRLNLTRTFTGAYREGPESFGITANTLAPAHNRFIAPGRAPILQELSTDSQSSISHAGIEPTSRV